MARPKRRLTAAEQAQRTREGRERAAIPKDEVWHSPIVVDRKGTTPKCPECGRRRLRYVAKVGYRLDRIYFECPHCGFRAKPVDRAELAAKEKAASDAGLDRFSFPLE